ncbi:NAD(P)-binding protein [Apiospora sp. TS-2023a]
MANSSKSNTLASESTHRLDLVGHVAVITGASRGIGRAIAFNLALRGCSILGTCTNEASLDSISSGLDGEVTQSYQEIVCLRPAQLRITGLIADIFSLDCSALIANKLEESFNGRVDILINSACDPMPRANRQESHYVVLGLKLLAAKRKRYVAGLGAAHHFDTVSLLTGLTQTEAVMNCGPDMVAEFQKEFFPAQSIPRFGQPQDVADVVGLICSAEAKWITGSVISASGGGIKIG